MGIPKDIEFRQFLKKVRQKHYFKDCLHPNKKFCQGNIISCHSIQRNRYLRNIAENGEVFMFDYSGIEPPKLRAIGIKKATTFNGFCSFHDKTVFQAIEDISEPAVFSERQCFLFSYRAFAFGFAAKRAYFSFTKALHEGNPPPPDEARSVFLGERDIQLNKRFFDVALMNKDHQQFIFRQRSIPGSFSLAISGFLSVDRDLGGNLLYNIHTTESMPERVPLLALSVLPNKSSLVVIVSYFLADASVYGPLVDSVFSMSDERFLQVISYWTVTYAENWAVSPSTVNSWSTAKRNEIERWFEETMGPTHSYLEFVSRIGSIL